MIQREQTSLECQEQFQTLHDVSKSNLAKIKFRNPRHLHIVRFVESLCEYFE